MHRNRILWCPFYGDELDFDRARRQERGIRLSTVIGLKTISANTNAPMALAA